LREILIEGWPWDVRIAARVRIHSTVAGEDRTSELDRAVCRALIADQFDVSDIVRGYEALFGTS
jgi:hypothetical protein